MSNDEDSLRCCVYPVHLGMLLPDWMERSSATYNGTYAINDEVSDVWQAEGQYTNYYAATADASNRPVRFWEHKKEGYEGLKQWDFDLGSYAVAVDEERFLIPEGCTEKCVSTL